MKQLVFCFGLVLGACSGSIHLEDFPQAENFVRDPRLEHPESMPQVSLALINTAENSSAEFLMVGGGACFSSRQIAYTAVLVRHPKGDLLIDSGMGPDIKHQFQTEMPFLMRGLMSFDNPVDARAQMRAAGIGPESIQHILLTHPHWDHAGGVESFANAKIWHPQVGVLDALRLADDQSGFFLSQIDGPEIQWQDFSYTDQAYENFDRSYDFYGDGSIVLVPMPGHTAASYGVFVNLPSGLRFLFTGDTTWLLDGFQNLRHKSALASWLVDGDLEKLGLPIAQVHQLMLRHPELIVVPAHDYRVQAELGFFPEFVDR
jgi:glyoxylase-like metal-dependent hydrolase (beta-lactamase superfamily II)